jgi:hypothetical protein
MFQYHTSWRCIKASGKGDVLLNIFRGAVSLDACDVNVVKDSDNLFVIKLVNHDSVLTFSIEESYLIAGGSRIISKGFAQIGDDRVELEATRLKNSNQIISISLTMGRTYVGVTNCISSRQCLKTWCETLNMDIKKFKNTGDYIDAMDRKVSGGFETGKRR